MKLFCIAILSAAFIVGGYLTGTLTSGKGYAMDNQEKGKKSISLPEPVFESNTSIEQALVSRRSVRSYSQKPLTLQDISQLLWAAQGPSGPGGLRTAPSAGALYPLKVYVAAGDVEGLDNGLYYYVSESHSLVHIEKGDFRKAIWQTALKQKAVRNAPAVFVFTGIFPKTTDKYGKRGVQYIFMETGHAAQNLSLQAESIDLGTVPIGAFDDAALQKVMKLESDTHPLYIMPVGHPER